MNKFVLLVFYWLTRPYFLIKDYIERVQFRFSMRKQRIDKNTLDTYLKALK